MTSALRASASASCLSQLVLDIKFQSLHTRSMFLKAFSRARLTAHAKPSPSSLLCTTTRRFIMTQQQATTQPAADWSATQYLKFGNERTRAVRDLVHNIPLRSPKTIIDLGCGPANSTAVLRQRFPHGHIVGMDSSPDMLSKARTALPDVEFVQGDLHTYEPPAGTDLLFSNAVFHWLRKEQRIPTILRLLQTQEPGGVLAFQVPDNYEEPSHRAMREVALLEGPWTEYFRALPAEKRPDLDPIETPGEWYDALIPYCEQVDVWHVHYQHVLEGPSAIVEWVRSTGLMPFLNVLPEGEARDKYVKAYEERLGDLYERLTDGMVMLRYPRLFVVATRK